MNKIFWVVIFLLCFSQGKAENFNMGEKASSFIKEFYSWYIREYYSDGNMDLFLPSFIKVDEGKYIFNTKQLCDSLKKHSVFNDEYIINDSIAISECNNAMLKEYWDYEPEIEFNLRPCNYLWNDRFIGAMGQKILHTIVKVVEVKNNKVNLEVMFYVNDTGYYKKEVLLKYKNDVFSISSISFDSDFLVDSH